MKKTQVTTYSVLLLTRPLLIFCVQILLFFIVGSWAGTFRWWPFQLIISNVICFFILFTLVRKDKSNLQAIYLHPFNKGLELGKVTRFYQRRNFAIKGLNILYDLGLFIIILLTLGLVALGIMSAVDSYIQTTIEFTRYEPLPLWAVLFITIFLPLTMIFVEIPWYFGYFFPKLERLFYNNNEGKNALLKAITLTILVFSLQHCFQPFFLNGEFLALRAIMLLPLLILIAWVIRIIPRLTPYILFLHGLLAIEVALKYWMLL